MKKPAAQNPGMERSLLRLACLLMCGRAQGGQGQQKVTAPKRNGTDTCLPGWALRRLWSWAPGLALIFQ